MQLFLIGFMLLSICEIFTIGGFPLERKVRIVGALVPEYRVHTTDLIQRHLGF
jgi:hypothetical protein